MLVYQILKKLDILPCMNKLTKQLILLFFILVFLNGCVVGTVASVPFKVAGAAINTVTPDIVGDTVSTTGDVVDMAIPF